MINVFFLRNRDNLSIYLMSIIDIFKSYIIAGLTSGRLDLYYCCCPSQKPEVLTKRTTCAYFFMFDSVRLHSAVSARTLSVKLE